MRFQHAAAAFASAITATTYGSDSWHQYVQSPNSRTILPAKVLNTTGQVSHADNLLKKGGGKAVLHRPKPAAKPKWPQGTKVSASSTHDGNYSPENAIDGDITTFWNDDTIGEYPDSLTITAPDEQQLDGVTIQMSADGIVKDFSVEALDGDSWKMVANVTENSHQLPQVKFEESVNTKSIRINATKDDATSKGEYTRIVEVYPGIVDEEPVPSIVVDFGKNIVGWLSIGFGAAKENPGIRLAFSESLEYLTDLSDFTRSNNGDTITPGSDQIAVGDGNFVWTDKKGCQHGSSVCSDGLHGFRYLKLYLDALQSDLDYANQHGEVEVDYLSLEFSAYLGTPDTFTGSFECSDTELNHFWYDAAYTNDLTVDHFRAEDVDPRWSATPGLEGKQVLFDGAKRDRDPYVGDLGVSARTGYLTHAEMEEAVTNILADLGDHQRDDGWIPPASINNYTLTLFDYPLWWVISSRDHLMYTGKKDYVKKYFNGIKKVLDEYYPSKIGDDGLIIKDEAHDAGGYGDYAFLPREGVVMYYNALYTLGLQYGASIAEALGNKDQSDKWLAEARKMTEAINEHLWDDSTGAYIDNVNNGTKFHAQDGNSIAVIAGISQSSQTDSLLKHFDSKKQFYGNPFYDGDLGEDFSKRVYAFISYFELEARFMSGNGASGIDQLRRTFGWMKSQGPGTFWEGIGPDGSLYEQGYTSLAHGWSTGCLPILTEHVLGVKPSAPGYKSWTIKPTLVDGITWAKGTVHTPSGDITVSWEVKDDAFSMDISAPKGTEGEVTVPSINGSKSTVKKLSGKSKYSVSS